VSVTLEGDPGCSALGHLYRVDGARRVCITCGHVEAPPPDADSDTGKES
jgi:hypothetical protein